MLAKFGINVCCGEMPLRGILDAVRIDVLRLMIRVLRLRIRESC